MSSPVQIGTEVLFCSCSVLRGVLPGDHVLEPGRRVLLDPLRETDAVLQRDVAEMVDRERDLRPDHLAHLGDVLLQEVEALLGEMKPGEGVADVVHVIAGVAPPAVVERLRPRIRSAWVRYPSSTPVGEPTAPGTCMICARPRSILRKV